MIAEAKAVQTRLLPISNRLGVHLRMKRLTDRLVSAAVEYHNALAHQTLRLKVLATDLDPDAKAHVATASSPSQVSDFFASLRSS